jgi:hypothetical protein
MKLRYRSMESGWARISWTTRKIKIDLRMHQLQNLQFWLKMLEKSKEAS